ncbi:hypothetical protein NLJ89_g7837 [Agrocybe chaxingu]|uniref:Uncharacterized protein n=1 Tax=Agrocybe chaxingu TaxID=84603 RepID=A0A9W8K2V8_9AGAR|nr:hypothetical protein NLJ89_g7837 [Agrocybe chaxingu]
MPVRALTPTPTPRERDEFKAEAEALSTRSLGPLERLEQDQEHASARGDPEPDKGQTPSSGWGRDVSVSCNVVNGRVKGPMSSCNVGSSGIGSAAFSTGSASTSTSLYGGAPTPHTVQGSATAYTTAGIPMCPTTANAPTPSNVATGASTSGTNTNTVASAKALLWCVCSGSSLKMLVGVHLEEGRLLSSEEGAGINIVDVSYLLFGTPLASPFHIVSHHFHTLVLTF